MHKANGKQVIEEATGIEYTVFGPIHGMFLLEGAGEKKFVTMHNLKKNYVYDTNKRLGTYYTTTAHKQGFRIRKEFRKLVREIDPNLEILYDSDSKLDYYRYPGQHYCLMTTWSVRSFKIYARVSDLAPARKRYITRRVGKEGMHSSLSAQIVIDEISMDTIALMRGVIIDVMCKNRPTIKVEL